MKWTDMVCYLGLMLLIGFCVGSCRGCLNDKGVTWHYNDGVNK